MTCIVSPSRYPSKKSLKEAIATNPQRVYIEDPSIFAPRSFSADEIPAGRKVVICPAVTRDNVSCSTCKLCSIADRKTIIGFPAHGTGKRKANVIAIRPV